MFLPSVISVLPFLITSAHALNDWSVPCFGGECSYDLPGSSEASGSLKIWGSPNAITDITKAAGWIILGCDKNALSQNIRLVCSSNDYAASGCDHLFQNGGPVGKIVRLPEECGRGPFARVARAWVDKDQSIPPKIAKTLRRRDDGDGDDEDDDAAAEDDDAAAEDDDAIAEDDDGTAQDDTAAEDDNDTAAGDDDAVAEDDDAAAEDNDAAAEDNNAAAEDDAAAADDDDAASEDGAAPAKDDDPNSQKAPEVQGLALDSDFGAVDPSRTGNVNIAIEGSNVPGEAGDSNILPPTSRRRRRVSRRGFLSFIEDSFNKFNSFDENAISKLPPIDIEKSFPIFKDSVSCPANGAFPATTASINIDADAKAHSIITLGVAAAGTIVPPKLTDFGIFVNMDAEFTGSVTLKGSASGVADSGRLSLFEVGVPGLDFPGVLTVGPSFKIEGQAKATLDIDVDMTVDLSYSVNGAKLFFPASQNHESGGNFAPGNTPLKLSVSPSVTSKGVVEAHLIPKLDLGISALGGRAEATVFVELDNSAAATLTLNGKASAGVTVDDGTTTSASGSVDGCASVDGGIDVNAGADGSFFGLFDASTSVPIFSKKFNVFKKCFGNGATRRQVRSDVQSLRRGRLSARALTCPKFGSSSLVALAA